MARLARAVAPGAPHHVLQRGTRGQRIFAGDADYKEYLELLSEGCANAGVALVAYCLLPNQVHLILVPRDLDGLRAALGEAHRRYTRAVNARRSRKGGLFRGRFASFPMDRPSLPLCARYVEQAPSRARIVERARDWRWSSARAHLKGTSDPLIDVKLVLDTVDDWREELARPLTAQETKSVGACERTGRPLGSPVFIQRLEKKLDRTLARQKPGPKPKRTLKRKK
ncbi:MAG: transposase [Alphaproteobacteria bacterium]|nr:transposase [Alphaproteobacteria bacterium]